MSINYFEIISKSKRIIDKKNNKYIYIYKYELIINNKSYIICTDENDIIDKMIDIEYNNVYCYDKNVELIFYRNIKNLKLNKK